MRRRTLVTGAVTLAAGWSGGAAAEAGGPVVLELFTSQGCSSCPPADALLGELSRETGVIALAWHVDYWNNLGWHDPFASRAFTERQRAYARLLGEEVYTPALVVNGARMVVGSDRASVRAAINASGRLPIAAAVARSGGTLTVEIGAFAGSASALVVAYDPIQVTAVGAGENAGRRLRDQRVARALWSRPAQPGRFSLSGIDPAQGAVLLVQDDGGRIIGAADSAGA
ncbi:MAG TPA: DUF1223 domain-containing protein [Rhodopila sp.]|nr:DUF1223 domain-containing protein [Rhodopila sp.]